MPRSIAGQAGHHLGWLTRLVLVTLTMVICLTAPAIARITSPSSSSQTLEEGGIHARAYLDWAQSAVRHTQASLEPITQAAEQAADLLIQGKDLAVRGQGLNVELGARAGGFYFYRSSQGKPGDVAVIAFTSLPLGQTDWQPHLQATLETIRQFKAGGSCVIVIASVAQLRAHDLYEEVASQCDHLLDNYAPADDGLFTDSQPRAVVPTFPVANAITAWAWQAELFAAMTRRGKTPAMYQSVAIAGARERNRALGQIRFHEDITLDPVAPGKLAQEYLQGVSNLLHEVGTQSWPAIRQAADRLVETRAQGGQAYVYVSAHYPPFHFGDKLAMDPGLLVRLNQGSRKFLAQPGPKDFILALGYCMPPGEAYWGDPAVFKQAGRGVAWVITSYDTPADRIPPGDILVDQRWAAGDAVVAVPGYDVKIFPPSGIITQTLGWAIIAQAWADEQARLAGDVVKGEQASEAGASGASGASGVSGGSRGAAQ